MTLKLCRPYDREPDDHSYGEPFDTEVDAFVGGASAWSLPRNNPEDNPRAAPAGKAVNVELHEDGPLLEFLLNNWQEIPNALGAVAGLISAWYAARTFRTSQLPPQDSNAAGGVRIKIGDVEISSDLNLSAEQLGALATAVARAQFSPPKGKTRGSATRKG
jgi:hypothetical protein